MFIVLIVLAIITAIFLILIVSVQSSKKEGLGDTLGHLGARQLIGIQKTGDLLEQITWGTIITLFILSLTISALLKKRQDDSLPSSPNLEKIQERTLFPELNHEDAMQKDAP